MAKKWYDIEQRGSRLESIVKQLNTKLRKILKKEDPTIDEIELALAYIDRIVKVEQSLKPYVEEITGLKKFLELREVKEGIAKTKPIYIGFNEGKESS